MKLPLALALGALLCTQAFGSEYAALFKARKFAEVERMATAKLFQDPTNADALIARSDVILASGDGKLEDAIKFGEQCIAAHPNDSGCHLAYGNALGAKATSGGMMAAMSLAGKIRDAFKKSVELDPQNVEARFSLLQYYMMAPAIAGGGSGKAKSLIEQTAPVNADVSKLLQARLDVAEDKASAAETAALAIKPGNEAVADAQRDVLLNVANKYLTDKKYPDAERVFREVQKRFPDIAYGLYGVGRVQQEQGKHKEAVASFEQVLVSYNRPQVHYRLGQSQQALNDKAKAVAAYEKALAFKSGLSKKLHEDAEEQLKHLKG